MSGALLQLASMGAQDVYLTSNPEITLFKKVYLKDLKLQTKQLLLHVLLYITIDQLEKCTPSEFLLEVVEAMVF